MTSAKESAFLLCSVSPETVTSEVDFTSSCQENTNSFFVCLVVFEYTVSILQVISRLKIVVRAPAIAFMFSPTERKKGEKGGRTPFFHVHLSLQPECRQVLLH